GESGRVTSPQPADLHLQPGRYSRTPQLRGTQVGGTLLAHSYVPPGPEPAGPATEVPPTAPDMDLDIERGPVLEAEPALLPAAEDPPALPAADPLPPVPAALVDHARKVAEDHRARTGTPIDTDTLRARLGVPPHLADAIAAHLT
ncbi:hypothetical protein ACH4PR_02870, partial [Streptomyces mirabilis]